jgi:CubicO group peptidase (beta-lactamase class C family)
VPVYSATKGAASAALLLALHQQGASPQMSMGELWPEFPLPYASIAQMMSHQCGLAAFSRTASVFDHEDCVRALEETVPAWQPPEHGYHPHTYGVMLDELMLRLTGERLWRYWEEYIRKPLNLDFYIGLPESEWNRVATLYPGKMDMSNMGTPFYLEYMNKGTPVNRAFNTLIGLNSVRQMNTPEAWVSGVPAFGGVASARGMAQFYQACLGLDELRVFPSDVRGWMRNVVIDGPDLTLKTPTAFSCGFMHDPADPATGRKLRHLFGSGGFGHAGAGGSHAFADPAHGLSFGYAMNRMDLNVLPGVKTRNLISAVMKEVAGECS